MNPKVGYALCRVLGIDPNLVTEIDIRGTMDKAEITLTRWLSKEEEARLDAAVKALDDSA
jgi:hypothetical protein